MSQNNKTALIITLVNLSTFGLLIFPLFEDMNLLRFLIIGFGLICLLIPLMFWEDKSDD